MATKPNLFAVVVALVFAFKASSACAAELQSYTVDISGTGFAQIDAVLRASSQLVTLRGSGPIPSFALVTRAQSDISRFQTAIDSFGYYANRVSITVDGLAADDPELAVHLDAAPANSSVSVKVNVIPGPLYHLGKITLDGNVPEHDRAALALKSGDAAVAGLMLDARSHLLSALEEDG